jgi:soluble lytic murein transglycosylase
MGSFFGAAVAGWAVVAGAAQHPQGLAAQVAQVEAVLEARGDLADDERRAVAVAIVEESMRAGYDPFLILGLIDVESDFRRDVVSNADARGLMQIQPATLGYLIDRHRWPLSEKAVANNPALCVRLGVRYVRQLHDRFKSLNAALMAYNMGPTKYASLSKDPDALLKYRAYPAAVLRDAAAIKRAAAATG